MLFKKISSRLYRYEGSSFDNLENAIYTFMEQVFTTSGPKSIAVEISPSFEKKLLREFKAVRTGSNYELYRGENCKRFANHLGVIYFFTRKLEVDPELPYGFKKAQRN